MLVHNMWSGIDSIKELFKRQSKS